jgi:hypothetical protein
MDQARDHERRGEAWLDRAKNSAGQSLQRASYEATIAQAYFSAAMAITNILLTDPAEGPEPVEF